MRKAIAYIWGTALVLVLWWLLAAVLQSPALPTPLATLPVLADEAGAIWPHFWVSFERIMLAMAIGTVLGAPLGLLLGRSKRADALFGPVLYILYPLPKVVFLPVLFVLLGLGGEAKVVLIAIAVFFQMMVTMRDAAKAVPQPLLEALRVTTGTAVAILFIAESMAGSTGLGYFIMHAWSVLEYKQMFAGIVAMAVMGVVIYEAFDVAEKRLAA